jgi:hypothetical protein
MVAHLMTHDDRFSVGRAIRTDRRLHGVVVLIGPDLLTDLRTNVLAGSRLSRGSRLLCRRRVYSRRLVAVPPVMMAAGQLTMSTVLLRRSCFCSIAGNLRPRASGDLGDVGRRCYRPHSPIDLLPHYLASRRDQRADRDLPHSGSAILLGTVLLPGVSLRQLAGMAAMSWHRGHRRPGRGFIARAFAARIRDFRIRGLTAHRRLPLNYMVKYQDPPWTAFAARRTRRAARCWPAERPTACRSARWRSRFQSLPAVMKHLDVLGDAGLVATKWDAR